MSNGAAHLCSVLSAHGITHAFGVPGSQNLALYEALRASSIRSVLTTNELAAGFMAIGYYRASGHLAPLITIPGPGFTWALTSIAEALQDSASLLHIVGRPEGIDHRHYFQAIDQRAIAGPLIKGSFRIDSPEDIEPELENAIRIALEGEPGPVLVEWTKSALESAHRSGMMNGRKAPQHVIQSNIREAIDALVNAERPLICVGQGAIDAAPKVLELAELLGAPVFSTASGRGILPEDHPLALCFDGERNNVATMNELISLSDLILVLGCKLGFSGTIGFQLKLPSDRVLRVDSSADVLSATCPSDRSFVEDADAFLGRVVPRVLELKSQLRGTWSSKEVSAWTTRLRRPAGGFAEPAVRGANARTVADFCAALRRATPRDTIVCADSGLHQQMLRRHFDIFAPRGLLFPSDYQSMGFGLPAAIGAKLAAPDRTVIAVIGDGGLAMTGLELLTAVREKISLTVIVFNDGYLGRIRLEQISSNGRTNCVALNNPDFETFAASVGASYALVTGDQDALLRECIVRPGVTLVELRLGDGAKTHAVRALGTMRKAARRLPMAELLKKLKLRMFR